MSDDLPAYGFRLSEEMVRMQRRKCTCRQEWNYIGKRGWVQEALDFAQDWQTIREWIRLYERFGPSLRRAEGLKNAPAWAVAARDAHP